MNCPVYAIDIEEDDFNTAFSVLDQIGLRAAAVTSPLKIPAAKIVKKLSPTASQFQSVNTLYKDQVWFGENTDLEGFQRLVDQHLKNSPLQSIAIWGGGGTLPIIQQVLPQALSYSVRTGEMRDLNIDSQEFIKQKLEGPEVLIWAAGPDAQPPLADWNPVMVIDLNYREDSLAREYALEVNAQYIDGLLMFKAQAEKQREFWRKFGR
jgi:shikimate 5-dehydrogenase